MKPLLTFFLCCLFLSVAASNTTYEKLTAVNKCWALQKDVIAGQLPEYLPADEHEWIRRHLTLVEQTLRARSVDGLSAIQRANRLRCLDDLHGYWQAGNFPINEDYAYRTPIFIDKHNNFCAVGYLVKASGHEAVSRMIAANTNLAYVYDMKYPELTAWAADNGFTIDELAWIQPSYPSHVHSKPIGRGVDGMVQELYVDSPAQRLYVGGSFIKADSTISANNIAYVTEAGGVYTWHNMGTGTNGQVRAITKYNNRIFAAGTFTSAGDSAVSNVAYWNDTAWHSAGCIDGTVNALAVFAGNLYAAGTFSLCPAVAGVNFAKWDGTNWQPIYGIVGRVNTLYVADTSLYLGGAFSYGTGNVNAMKWNETSGFNFFLGHVDNEIMDMELFQDSMYAVCKRTHLTDSVKLLLKLRGNSWNNLVLSASELTQFYPYGNVSYNTLCAEATTLNVGGQFHYNPPGGTYGTNCYSIGTGGYFNVDSEVNKMVLFKSDLIAGGRFKYGDNSTVMGSDNVLLNGIAKRYYPPAGVVVTPNTGTLTFYPNPAMASSMLKVENSFNATTYTVQDIAGKVLTSGALNNSSLMLPLLAPGLYLVRVYNEAGVNATGKLIVQQ